MPSHVKPLTLTLVFTAFLRSSRSGLKGSVEKKPASLLVGSFGKALGEIGRQVAGDSYASSLSRFDRFLMIE